MTELDPEVLILKRKRAELLQRKIRLMKTDGLPFYKPYAKQEAFHRAAGQFKRRLLEGGNRSGKTTMGAAEDCSWLRGFRPFFPEGDPGRTAGIPQHPVKGVVVTPDWEKTREVWTERSGDNPGKLWKFIGRDLVASTETHQTGALRAVSLKNGSTLKFCPVKAWKTDPMIAESSDHDFVHIDEPCPEKMYKGLARGLIDRGGAAWFTLTALNEPWIQDYFFPENENCVRAGAWAERVAIYDNPHLSAQSIKEFEELLNEDEKECRLLGIPLRLAGLVYKEFSQTKHVLPRIPRNWVNGQPPAEWATYYHIDPHPQTPMAVLFCAVDPMGRHFYYDEIYDKCTVSELAAKIGRRLRGRNVIRGRIDPIAKVRDPITDTTIQQELARHGIVVQWATKDREFGTLKVKENLKREDFIYFSPECRRTLWEIRRYAWDEKENKPVDRDDHMMENLYRMELDNMIHVEPTTGELNTNILEIPFADMDLPDLTLELA